MFSPLFRAVYRADFLTACTDVAKRSFAHCSYEAGILEDADVTPPDDMWKLTDDPRNAPDTPEDFTLAFEKGIPSALTLGGKKITDSVEIFTALNELGRKHGEFEIQLASRNYTQTRGN